MRQLIDRPSISIPNFDRIIVELSPYLNQFEIDRILDFMDTIRDSKLELNWSVDDCSSQLKIILGSERYQQVKAQWAIKNQHLIPQGRTKYVRISDGLVFDGLDPDDNPRDYKEILM